MKIRENELHEPIIGTSPQVGKGIAVAKCSACDCTLEFAQGKDRESAIISLRKNLPKYCPNCGARLKEIENDK